MSALEEAGKAVDAIQRGPGESVDSFARRLHSAHAQALVGRVGVDDALPSFGMLSREEQAMWMDRAALRSSLPRE